MKILARLRRWLAGPQREPRYQDFIHYGRDGSVSVDLWGWWRTEPGRKEREQQLADFKRFEENCRRNSPDGSFSFYD